MNFLVFYIFITMFVREITSEQTFLDILVLFWIKVTRDDSLNRTSMTLSHNKLNSITSQIGSIKPFELGQKVEVSEADDHIIVSIDDHRFRIATTEQDKTVTVSIA